MKTLMISLLVVLGVQASWAAPFGEQKPDSTLLKGPKILAKVDGLTCPFCAYGLEKKLKKLSGVKAIEIRVDKGEAMLTLEKGAVLAKKDIRRAIQDAGFTPREISAATDAPVQLKVSGVTCEGCIERVKTALKDTPCAEIVDVDFKSKEAVLACSGDKSQHQQVKKRIEQLGFQVKEIVTDKKP